jgi:Tfp pilus assembly protein PilO
MKTTSQTYKQRIILHRWDALCVLLCIIICILAYSLWLPYGKKVFKSMVDLRQNMAFVHAQDSITAQINTVKAQEQILQKKLSVSSSSVVISDATVPGFIYECAAKSGIKTSKVEIAPTLYTPNGIQIPVRFVGTGDYAACGKCIDAIEHINNATRIKEMSLKKSSKGTIDLFLDFSVFSGGM